MQQTRDYSDYHQTGPLFRSFAGLPPDAPARAKLRDELIRLHLPLADHIGRRYAHRGEPLDDVVQAARLGLVKAVDRFDPDRATEFLSFAVPTITGEVRRHFRDTTWYVRVPRGIQDLHARLRAAADELAAREGSVPTARMLARHLGVDLKEVHEGLKAPGAYRPTTLDAPVRNAAPLAELLGGPDPALELAENRAALARLLLSLSDRDRHILGLRFFEGWTQAQIAREIGLSQMQVSRILARTLARLRTDMLATR